MENRFSDMNYEAVLVVEGSVAALAAFRETAFAGSDAFTLSRLLPVPEGLRTLQYDELAAFQVLVMGDLSHAAELLEEAGLPCPFAKIHGAEQWAKARQWLAEVPDRTASARTVQRNLVEFGAVDAVSWKQSQWGGAKDIEISRVEDDSASRFQVRIGSSSNRTVALSAIAMSNPRLFVGYVFRLGDSQHGYALFNEGDRTRDEVRYEPVAMDEFGLLPTYLERPPARLSRDGG